MTVYGRLLSAYIRKKHLFLLGGDVFTYTLLKPFASAKFLMSCLEQIKSDLLGAGVAVDYANLLNNYNMGIFFERVSCYLDYSISQQDIDQQNIEREIENCITEIYLQNIDVQKEIIKMVTEITNETNKNSKIEKVNLILSIISNTASISPAFFSFIKTLLEKLW